jgi:hypothetical protein
MSHFKIEDSQLKKFQKLIGKEFPRGFQKVTAEYLNTMAFEQRKENKKNLEQQLTIRDQRFLNNSLWAQKTKPVSINQQIAISGSIHFQKGTGWEEQQTGKPARRKHAVTPAARGGDKNSKVLPKYRFNKAKPVTPSQYQGNFYFMMRVLGSRGGGTFYLNEMVKTKRGQLVPGLWLLIKKSGHKSIGGKLVLLQKRDKTQTIRRQKWENDRFEMIKQRGYNNALKTLEFWKQSQRQKMGLK